MGLFDNMNKQNVQAKVPQSGQAQSVFWNDEATAPSVSDTNKLIRNTYTLLSLTLFFSAITGGIAMVMNAAPIHWILYLVGFLGLFFLTNMLSNSVWGLVSVFALTGFLGFNTGGIINVYLGHFANGQQIVTLAFSMTAAIFLGLSGYALTTKKDFSYLASFLFAGVIVVLIAAVANIFFQIPALSLALSAVMVLLMCGYILYDTSNIVNGHETNYIMATVALYVDIYILFINLLQLLGALMGEE
ncbi:Bax inhibitor-1/YccA family protein [Candidatus Albibeggiatoa sp. nov. BB20]|uniref:Bax inhibitor-1/YccA family protein n=1 Tax=Candidatus Albibeggiatoa sp. nov. BB20 TaxID=3162723 RepID=UPI0033659E31